MHCWMSDRSKVKVSRWERCIVGTMWSRCVLAVARRGWLNWMTDESYLKIKYRAAMGEKLSLEAPETFNEKLQWLKLHDRKPEYTMMVDKYKVREYIKDQLGEEYLIPLLGVWDDPDDIDFDTLPNQFVLKCNHNSGLGMCICKDKSKLDIPKVKAELRKGLAQDYYLTGREWPYKDVPRKIICEKYMEDGSGDALQDFKFFCFNGEPKMMYVSRDASCKPYTDFYDMDFCRVQLSMVDPNSELGVNKPENFEQMKKISARLSRNIPFLRVDFYEIKGALYLGELTFFHSSGFGPISPNEWAHKLGSWIKLPVIEKY